MTQPNANLILPALRQGIDEAQRLGASAAKIQYGRGEQTSCGFEAGRLKTSDVRQSIWYNIEVLAGGRRGSASGNDLADLKEMVGRAVTLAKVGAAAHFNAYPAASSYAKVRTHSHKTAALALTDLIAACQPFVDTLRKHDKDLFIGASAGRHVGEYALVTSGGVEYSSEDTRWWLGGYVQRTDGTDMLFAGDHRAWRDVNELFDPAYIAQKTLDDLHNSQRIVDPPTGKVPVLLPPQAVGYMLWPVTMGTNGRNVAKGDSPLKGRLGEQVLDRALTIIDDPHLDYANGAAELDGDGIPTRRTMLFDRGVLKTFLYDLDSAGLADAHPTGHNGCNPWSLTALPGSRTSQQLLESIEDGLLIKNLMGFGQSNIINGDFASNVALGFRIKNGKIIGRVKNTMAAGNIYDLLKADVQVSRDVDPMHRMPWMLVQGVNVSGR